MGKPERGRKTGRCIDCGVRRKASWRLLHPDRERESQARIHKKCRLLYPDRVRESDRLRAEKWRLANPDRVARIRALRVQRRRERALAADPLAADDPEAKDT
jgi:hypothetical protein